jgi:phage repressor protein C with HTH and peptisase S24 domain
MEWSEKIQRLEQELGIQNDRGQLAKLIGIRAGAIADIKNGKAKNPGSNIALLLINRLGVNPKWLEEEELPIFSNRLINYPFAVKNLLPKGSKNNLSQLQETQSGRLKTEPLDGKNIPSKGSEKSFKQPLQKEQSADTTIKDRLQNQPFAGKPWTTKRLQNQPNDGECHHPEGLESNLSPLQKTQNGGIIKDASVEEREMTAVGKPEAPLLELARKKIPVIAEGEETGLLIPVIGQGLSAGLGFDYDEGEIVRFIKIPAWIARKSKDLVALPIYGDSMEPTISRGDLAVCGSGGFKDDGIYVLRDEERGLMFCKRVVWAPGGWTIMSDNPRYSPLTVEDTTIQIVARVIAAVKEIK